MVKVESGDALTLKCVLCDFATKWANVLKTHKLRVHKNLKAICAYCSKALSVDNLARHVREQHKKAKKSCPHCKKEFGMSNLSRHIRTVHNNEVHECPECGKAFSISNLNKHIKAVHDGLRQVCQICSEEVKFPSLSVHNRKYHGIGKPFNDITPRGPNLKLRKYKREITEDTQFSDTMDVKTETNGSETFEQNTEQENNFRKIRPGNEASRQRNLHISSDQKKEEGETSCIKFDDGKTEVMPEPNHKMCDNKEENASLTIQIGNKSFNFEF